MVGFLNLIAQHHLAPFNNKVHIYLGYVWIIETHDICHMIRIGLTKSSLKLGCRVIDQIPEFNDVITHPWPVAYISQIPDGDFITRLLSCQIIVDGIVCSRPRCHTLCKTDAILSGILPCKWYVQMISNKKFPYQISVFGDFLIGQGLAYPCLQNRNATVFSECSTPSFCLTAHAIFQVMLIMITYDIFYSEPRYHKLS